jgi:amidohydrolase
LVLLAAACILIACVSDAPAAPREKQPIKTPGQALLAEIDRRAEQVNAKVIAWRRDIHEHPELSNREVRTAKLVADHLTALGIEVKTGVAHTGVVGVLRGGKPGPCVALRADMDALPVTEETGLPFASKARGEYNGQQVGVMHACGHDVHTAVLMGVAEVLAGMRKDIPGAVKFVFQPAEEGAPANEEGGAELMIKEGALENPKPEAIFALHVFPDSDAGTITYRPGGAMASADVLRIVVRGAQTHGAMPWGGIDPIVVSAQIIMGLQTIESRQVNVTENPSIVTIGIIRGGVRSNIIPDTVEMVGTIRALDEKMRKDIHSRVKRTAERIAESAGATAEVAIELGNPVTYNDPSLTARMVPTLDRVAGKENVFTTPPKTGAEDFSLFAEKVPGLYIFLGSRTPGADPATVAQNHSPRFMVDESCIPLGVRALAAIAVEYLAGK